MQKYKEQKEIEKEWDEVITETDQTDILICIYNSAVVHSSPLTFSFWDFSTYVK